MSRQNSPEQKRLRRSVRAIRKAGGPGYTTKFDLVEYLVSRGLARTKKQARLAMTKGKVTADGVTIGRDVVSYVDVKGKTKVEIVPVPLIDTHLKDKVEVFGTPLKDVLHPTDG